MRKNFCWSSALLTLGQLVRNNGTSRGACHNSKSRICAATLFWAEWIYLDNNISLSQQQAESRATIIDWIVRRRGNWRRTASPLPLFSLLSSPFWNYWFYWKRGTYSRRAWWEKRDSGLFLKWVAIILWFVQFQDTEQMVDNLTNATSWIKQSMHDFIKSCFLHGISTWNFFLTHIHTFFCKDLAECIWVVSLTSAYRERLLWP